MYTRAAWTARAMRSTRLSRPLSVLVAVVACCSAFFNPQLPRQSFTDRVVSSKLPRRSQTHYASRPWNMSSRENKSLSDYVHEPAVTPPKSGTQAESLTGPCDRRTLVEAIPSTLAAGMMGLAALPVEKASARASPRRVSSPTKVVVLGGSGFVGSRVCEMLVEAGATVSSVSRTGSKPTQWAAGQRWLDEVKWNKGDPTMDDLSSIFSGASAVISCVGVILGTDEELERGNGDVNVAAASQAEKAKVGRFIYVSVSHLVPEAVGGLAFKGYFDGKQRAEDAIAQSFPKTGVVIKPAFIYGGDSFALTPPRVSDGYGSTIDTLLSSGPIRAIAGISPGLIKVALSPPVSRDSVALACVAGALGRLEGTTYDGADEINAASLRA